MSRITVKCKNEHLRRAGIEFTREGVVIETDELTQEQVDAIEAEPLLVIEAGDAPLIGGKKVAKAPNKAK